MNRKIWIIIFTAVTILLHSIPEYRTVKVVLLKEFKYGSKDNEIGFYETPKNDKGPNMEYYCKGLGFDFDDNIYFADLANKRYTIYDYDLNFLKIIQTKFSGGVQLKFLTNDLIFRYSNSREFSIVDINKKELLSRVYIDKIGEYKFTNTEDNFIYYDNTVFHWTEKGEIVSFVNPSPEGNKSFTPPEETRKNIKKKKYKGLKIDDKDRIFLNDKLLTRNFYHFITYWGEKHKNMIPPVDNIEFVDYTEFKKFSTGFAYYGEDKDGNTYWGTSIFSYYVFNKEGWMIDFFRIPDEDFINYGFVNDPATIHKYGDIYLIGRDYKKEKYDLMTIPRTWGYDPKPGICAEDNVRVRVRPSLKAEIVSFLKKDEKIEILDKTDEKTKINNMENYWIKIKTGDGKYGWAYGEWINEEKK